MTNDNKYTSGHLDSEQLLRYQRHLMTEEERLAVEKHFEECELCSDAVKGVEGMSDSTRIYPIMRELKHRMKKRKVIRKKPFSTTDILSIILIFFVLGIILLIAFYFFYLKKYSNNSNMPTNNVAVFFDDSSLNKENPSVELFIDNRSAFQSDSISKLGRQGFYVSLTTGKHFIMTQTLDKKFTTYDTIQIENPNQKHLLSISFNYNPPIEWWNDYVVKQSYKVTLIKNKLNPDTTIKWLMDSISRQVSKEDESSSTKYIPCDRCFKIRFEKQPLLE